MSPCRWTSAITSPCRWTSAITSPCRWTSTVASTSWVVSTRTSVIASTSIRISPPLPFSHLFIVPIPDIRNIIKFFQSLHIFHKPGMPDPFRTLWPVSRYRRRLSLPPIHPIISIIKFFQSFHMFHEPGMPDPFCILWPVSRYRRRLGYRRRRIHIFPPSLIDTIVFPCHKRIFSSAYFKELLCVHLEYCSKYKVQLYRP